MKLSTFCLALGILCVVTAEAQIAQDTNKFEAKFDKTPFEIVAAANNYVNLIANNPDLSEKLLNKYASNAADLLDKAILNDNSLCYAYVSYANLKLWLYLIKGDKNALYEALDFLKESEEIDKYYKATYFYYLNIYFFLKEYKKVEESIYKYESYFDKDKKNAYFIAWEVCLLLFSREPKDVKAKVETKIRKIINAYTTDLGDNIQVNSDIYLWAMAVKENGYDRPSPKNLPIRDYPSLPVKIYYPFLAKPTMSVHYLKSGPEEDLPVSYSQIYKIVNKLKNLLKNSINHRFEVIEISEKASLKEGKNNNILNPAYRKYSVNYIPPPIFDSIELNQ